MSRHGKIKFVMFMAGLAFFVAIVGSAMVARASQVLLYDDASKADPIPIWGSIDCEQTSRHARLYSGGNYFRRLTIIDGDDVWGERCELGLNNHRTSPTALYHEGQYRVTRFSMRLGQNFPLATQDWQVVMQMKQTQPSANGGGTPVISLSAHRGVWALHRSSSVGPSSGSQILWSTPARTGRWTRFSFSVKYSQYSSVGWIKVYVDLNGDGDNADLGEQSPYLRTYTLKRETEGGSSTDGIAPGESIPSHLRIGPYHNSSIPCPPPGGCSLDIDNIRVTD